MSTGQNREEKPSELEGELCFGKKFEINPSCHQEVDKRCLTLFGTSLRRKEGEEEICPKT